MTKTSKVMILLFLIIVGISFTFIKLHTINAADDQTHPFFVSKSVLDQGGTEVYDIYADFTYHPDYKFNHANFRIV